MPVFEMERMQSTWEHQVDCDLSESGVAPVSLQNIVDLGVDLDLDALASAPLGYSQTNGTLELREALVEQYPGATVDHVEVTNGASEANFITALTLLGEDDEVAFEVPNYMQLFGIPAGLGVNVRTFSLRADRDWEPDWDQFDQAVTRKTRLVYVSHPNNPTGSVLSKEAMRRIVRAVERADAFLLADEVYHGAEYDGRRTPTFWGMSDRVIVTSGLSKAFGLPGLRIGWIVGQPEFVAECWAQHDYVTICPSAISDMVARVVVRKENREKLFARGAATLAETRPVLREWIERLDGLLEYVEPKAGAFAFVKYNLDIPSVELTERLRLNQGVLVVPGSFVGLEGYLRIGIGVAPKTLKQGLDRISNELRSLVRGTI